MMGADGGNRRVMIDAVNADPHLQGALAPLAAGGVVPVMTHTTITNVTSAGITINIPTGQATYVCIFGGAETGRRRR
ncbi:hypothetical protein ACOACO_01410 [Nocardioides sp. CPCC 205120]|uniref:hypothetical protein n=1 Tax=Nocardioides sp. CPCC 205120 TaxID=3406462 RepID=UPI003B505FE0